jgi:hypothetical protein
MNMESRKKEMQVRGSCQVPTVINLMKHDVHLSEFINAALSHDNTMCHDTSTFHQTKLIIPSDISFYLHRIWRTIV